MVRYQVPYKAEHIPSLPVLICGITWKTFLDKTCQGCPINNEDYFCKDRCPSNSYALNSVMNGCGVSELQPHSILLAPPQEKLLSLGGKP